MESMYNFERTFISEEVQKHSFQLSSYYQFSFEETDSTYEK